MKTSITKWLNGLRVLNKVKTDDIDNLKLSYNALSPINDAHIDDDYKKALDWALKNKRNNDIKNIALTGPYGSGKSSILKTYIANYKENDLEFLQISLATFKEEEDNPGGPQKEDLLRQIELSILQQIFYREEDSKIPDSRFRKIKNYTKQKLRLSTIVLSIFMFSLFHLLYPELLEHLLKTKLPDALEFGSRYFAVLMVMIGFVAIIYRSIRVLSGIKLSKLNIQNAEIQVGEDVNKSILNHHIDEILYFFEVTKYNVVIIEDLDRFRQTEIFTKLREINLLLNSSKKINREIVFIYAVRDDMFKDQNERTKFFDFIIPVIPVINPSNSSQKLLEKKELIEFGISESLIDSISLFIDDMRLLHNVANEFYLYHQKLNKGLNQDRLLAIIVYKNIFPKDFTLLSNNEGILYNTINSKQIYRDAELNRLEEKLKVIREEIKELESLKIKDVKELRLMYLPFFMSNLPGFTSFHVGGVDTPPEQMTSKKNFEWLSTGKANYRYNLNYSQNIGQIATLISSIEGKVDANHTYLEREKKIEDWNANKIEVLRREIHQIEQDKFQIRNLNIRELLAKNVVELDIIDPRQKKLVSVLLRDGYINEDYLDYISLFYEGSITKADHEFFINVKSQVSTDFNHKLHKISKLIPKISELEFDKEYVLNYSLMDEVLNNPSHQNIRDKLFTKLNDESEVSIRFIDGFLDSGNSIASFVMHLVKQWNNVWTFLENKSNFTQERKEIYFKSVMAYADVVDIKKLYEDNYFKSYLLQRKDFLNVIPHIEKLKNIIKVLDIKFTELDINDVPSKELIDYIYNGNFYSLNIGMIKLILSVTGNLNETDFNLKNYSAILNTSLNKLEEYIQQNINEYVQAVYLKLEANVEEEESMLIDLLNIEDLTIENKKRILKQVNTIINDFSIIEDLRVADLLFEESKILPIWENVFDYYESSESKIKDALVKFLSVKSNATLLSKKKINSDPKNINKYTDFHSALALLNQLSDEIYDLILKSFYYRCSLQDLVSLSKSKLQILLKYNVLPFNSLNYDLLKKAFAGLQIQFLERNKESFLQDISIFTLDSNDIADILKSDVFNSLEKNKFLENIKESLYSSNKSALTAIGKVILTDNTFKVSDTILTSIITNNELSNEQRIQIFYLKSSQIQKDYFETFLNSLGEPYSDITIRGKNPLLVNSSYNLKLIEILQVKDYISSFSEDEKGLRVRTFRNPNDK